MKATTSEGCLWMKLRDLYNAEQQLIKALPKMAKAATSWKIAPVGLRGAFSNKPKGTPGGLKQIFQALGESMKVRNARAWKESSRRAPRCSLKVTRELEGTRRSFRQHSELSTTRLRATGQYMPMRRLSGETEAANPGWSWTLNEEKETDQKLTDLSESNK